MARRRTGHDTVGSHAGAGRRLCLGAPSGGRMARIVQARRRGVGAPRDARAPVWTHMSRSSGALQCYTTGKATQARMTNRAELRFAKSGKCGI